MYVFLFLESVDSLTFKLCVNLNMFRIKQTFILFSLFLFINSALGIKCYTCSYAKSAGIEGQDCIDDPDAVKAVNKITPCDKKYCSIIRQEKSGNQNSVESISRTCENKPHVSTFVINRTKQTQNFSHITNLIEKRERRRRNIYFLLLLLYKGLVQRWRWKKIEIPRSR